MMMINFRTKHSRILHMIKLPVFFVKKSSLVLGGFSHAKILHIQAAALLKYFLSSFFFFAQLSLTQIHSIFFSSKKGKEGIFFFKKKLWRACGTRWSSQKISSKKKEKNEGYRF